LRMGVAVDDGPARLRFGLALMNAAWGLGRDITDPAALIGIADEVGLDGRALSAQAETQAIKDRLATVTAAAAAEGIFGVPTFVLAGEIFWGADRLDAVLRRAAGTSIDETHLAAVLARPAAATRKR
jgi:2-hydroxychromene-2-carboxylate isomerase